MKRIFFVILIVLSAQFVGARVAHAITCTLSITPTTGPSGTQARIVWRVSGTGAVYGSADFGNGDSDTAAGTAVVTRTVNTVYNGAPGTQFDLSLYGEDDLKSCYRPSGSTPIYFRISGGTPPGNPVCSNNLDDDGDGYTDFPNDCGCTDAQDATEANSGGCNNVSYSDVTITTSPVESLRWQTFCPPGPYTCNLRSGTGSKTPAEMNALCQNGQCAGAGDYSVHGATGGGVNQNPGYDCVGSTDFRPWTRWTEPINLFLDCTPVATPTPSTSEPPPSSPPPLMNNSICTGENIPSTMTVGESRPVSITFQNTGTSTWINDPIWDYDVSLSPWPVLWPYFSPPFQDTGISPASPVPPGGSVTINLNLVAPATPGVYPVNYQMFQQGVAWFGGTCGNSVTVNAPPPTVTLTAAPATVAYGGTSVLTWSSTDATSCTSTNGNAPWPLAFRDPAGGAFIANSLLTTTTFTLTCTGSGGTVAANTIVTVNPPLPPSAVIQSVTQPNYCTSVPAATVSWLYSGSGGLPQGKYQMQISPNAGFLGTVFDSLVRNGANTSTGTGIPNFLTYGSTYWARVKVWDSLGTESAWSPSAMFSTPAGAFPKPSITFTPANPPADTPIQFSGSATGNPDSWSWLFSDGGTDSVQNPVHTFIAEGPASAELTVTNANGTCTTTRLISISRPVPGYREVRPGQ